MKNATVNLGGKRWTVEFTGRLPGTTHGECDERTKTIRINKNLATRDLLEIILHEFMHAEFPFLDEETVDTAGLRISRALERIGWITKHLSKSS